MTDPDEQDIDADIAQRLAEAKAMFAPKCEECLTLATQVATLAARHGNVRAEAEARLWWGRSLLVMMGAAPALPVLRRALRLALELDDKRLLADVHLSLAQCHVGSNTPAALQNWLKSLELALQIDAVDLYAEVYLGIGNLYLLHDDLNSALHYHAIATEFASAQRDRDLRAKSNIHLASILVKLERHALAEHVLHTAEAELILPLRRDWQAEIYNYLGAIHMRQRHVEQARDFLERAYAINLDAGFLWGQTVNLLGLGQLARAQGDDVQAEQYLLRATEVVAKFESPNLVQQIHLELSQLYEARGDFVRALMHHVGYHDHYMLIMKNDLSARLNSLASRRLAAAEIRLKLLSSEIELSQLRQQTSERASRMKQLEAAAYRDALTGVLNRRALDERLPLEIQEAHEQGYPLSVAVLDFDHFKHVNDRFSHLIGDKVLQAGVARAQETLRDGDLLYRYGGEEFVLVLPHTNAIGALHVAERVRSRVAEHDWDSIVAGLSVTISVGVAMLSDDDQVEDIVGRADAALYQAKQGGRNRVFMQSEEA
ncbi:GGDEF domain-containing protein [Chitiniphilus shinanonensis]|uniref:diguanylate cyclase n=1 Tax=Chitiniphilus shinanonensis TaxID=553088 RepID=A0ABQ6BT48_9NEIS|nr:GGDEF domain-containing protein [Chitiniphilus shinanonensis]GLS04784.1 GGDEF domain-containing protein [Chitiniphilus shinanonensis]